MATESCWVGPSWMSSPMRPSMRSSVARIWAIARSRLSRMRTMSMSVPIRRAPTRTAWRATGSSGSREGPATTTTAPERLATGTAIPQGAPTAASASARAPVSSGRELALVLEAVALDRGGHRRGAVLG